MKKSIFILAALFAATFANAQITLEGTITTLENCTTLVGDEQYFDIGYIPVHESDSVFKLYNTDGTLYKQANLPIHKGAEWHSGSLKLECKNFFTNDDKICVVQVSEGYVAVYNEDGQLVKDFGYMSSYPYLGIQKINGVYKFFIETYAFDSLLYTLRVYSLPGNGEFQDVVSPSAPRKSARKILHNDQVIIENADHTYTLTGQELK